MWYQDIWYFFLKIVCLLSVFHDILWIIFKESFSISMEAVVGTLKGDVSSLHISFIGMENLMMILYLWMFNKFPLICASFGFIYQCLTVFITYNSILVKFY